MKTWVKKIRSFKANDEEYEAIKKAADTFARGNISDWIREACTNYRPYEPYVAVPVKKKRKK